MYQALIIFHVVVAAGIITLVLLQQGRGADAGAAFGSGASGTVFGARGSASFLTRCTAVFAALFFASSLGLAILGDTQDSDESFMDEPAVEQSPPDLPPGELLLNGGGVSDMPDLPVGLVEPLQSGDATSPEPNDGYDLPADTMESPTVYDSIQTLPEE